MKMVATYPSEKERVYVEVWVDGEEVFHRYWNTHSQKYVGQLR